MLLNVLSNPLNDAENPLSQGLCPLNISTVGIFFIFLLPSTFILMALRNTKNVSKA